MCQSENPTNNINSCLMLLRGISLEKQVPAVERCTHSFPHTLIVFHGQGPSLLGLGMEAVSQAKEAW